VPTEKGREVSEARASQLVKNLWFECDGDSAQSATPRAPLQLCRARADRETWREADVYQHPRTRIPECAGAVEESPAPPRIAPPAGLVAWRLEVPGGPFVLLEWPSSAAAGADCWRRLTLSERDVTELLVAGLSNAEIARRRGSSARTVANQVASIFRKVGVASRLELQAAIATSVPRQKER
jgi:DNA-binding CsgD family transcriptional regulator